MAGDEDSSKFKLDLDTSDFVSGANEALDAIKSVGSKDNLSELIGALGSVGPLIGAMGAAFFAVKGTMDAVFDAENIKGVNAEFETLSQNAGLFSDKLKEGLVESAKGWADETTVMGAANKALVELEGGAEKLPEVMELARKATAVMGGDMISNFEAINQAVATGSTRHLRHLGLIIDSKKAYAEYAASIGTTVGALSKAGQQQALMNAVLDQGKEKFGSVNSELKVATNAWQELKTAFKEAYEAGALVIDKLFGGFTANAIHVTAGLIHDFGNTIKGVFGSNIDQAKDKISALSGSIKLWEGRISSLQEMMAKDVRFQSTEKQAELNAEIKKYADQIEAAKKSIAGLGGVIAHEKDAARGPSGESEPVSKASAIDLEKDKAQKEKHAADMLALNKRLTSDELSSMTSVEDARAVDIKQRAEAGKAMDVEIAKVKEKEQQGVLTHKQANEQIVALNKLKDTQIQKDDENLERMELQAEQKRLASATRIDQQLSASASVNARQAAAAWKASGQIGGAAMNSFQSHATSAFKAIGDGSKSASDALKDAFLGTLGDMAAKQGEFMMLDAFKTFPAINAPEFAAGGALVALGGALGAAGGGSSSTAIGGGSSLGNDTGAANTPSPAPGPGTGVNGNGSRSNLNINIVGSVLGDEATARWVVDKVRQAADSQAYTTQSVNGGFGG